MQSSVLARVVLGAFGVAILVPGLVQGFQTGRLVARLLVIAATTLVFLREHNRTRFRWTPVVATVLASGLFLAPFQFGLTGRTLPYAFALDATGVGAALILAAFRDWQDSQLHS